MSKFHALESYGPGLCPQVRAGPFVGEYLLEVPQHDRGALFVEQVDGSIPAFDLFIDHILMPTPQTVDLSQTVFEDERRVFRRPGKAVHESILTTFTVVEELGFHL